MVRRFEIHCLWLSSRNFFQGENLLLCKFLSLCSFFYRFRIKFQGGQAASGGRPPAEESQACNYNLFPLGRLSKNCNRSLQSPSNGFCQSFITIGSCNHLMRIISTYVGNTKKSEEFVSFWMPFIPASNDFISISYREFLFNLITSFKIQPYSGHGVFRPKGFCP